MSVEGVDLGDLKRRMQGALSVLKTDFAGLRTGRFYLTRERNHGA